MKGGQAPKQTWGQGTSTGTGLEGEQEKGRCEREAVVREPQVEKVSEVSSCRQRRWPVRYMTEMEPSGSWRDEEGPEHGGQGERGKVGLARVRTTEG